MEKRTKGIIYLLIVAAVWGFSFVATKVLLKYLGPASIVFFRFLMATALLFVLCRKKVKYSKYETVHIVLAGFLGITCYYMFENYALTFTTATSSALISSTVPIFFLMTHDAAKRKFSRPVKYLGACMALLGIGILILNGKFNLELNPIGDFLMFGSVFSWVVYTFIIERMDSKNIIAVSRDLTLAGTAFLLPFFAYEAQNMKFNMPNTNDIMIAGAALVFLGVLCSALGFVFWNKAMHLAGSATATNALYLIPPIAIIGDSIILGNIPNIYVSIGAALVLAGVYLSERGNGHDIGSYPD